MSQLQEQFSTAWDEAIKPDMANELEELERSIQTKAKLPYQGSDYTDMVSKRKQLRQALGLSTESLSVAKKGWLSSDRR